MMKAIVGAVVILFLYVCIARGADNNDPAVKAYADKYVQFAQENPTTSKWFKALWLETNAKSKTFEAILLKFLKSNNYPYANRVSVENIKNVFPNPSFTDVLQEFGESSGRFQKEYGHLTQDNASEQAANNIKVLGQILDSVAYNNTYILWANFENDYLSYFSNVASDTLKMAVNREEGFIADAKCQFFENCKK